MEGSPGSSRPALGQVADLGAFYDARTDSFLPTNLIAGNPPPSILRSSTQKSQQAVVINGDSLPKKLAALGVDDDLAASILARLVPLSGASTYLTSTRRSEATIEGAVRFTITTEQMTLQIGSADIRPHISAHAFQNGNATHVVLGITFGAECIIGAQAPCGKDIAQSQGLLWPKLSKLAAYCEGNLVTTSMVKLKDRTSTTDADLGDEFHNLDIAIFSDVPEYGSFKKISGDTLSGFIRSFPSAIKATSGGRGVNLTYTLASLEWVSYILNINSRPRISLTHPPQGMIKSFIHLYQRWLDIGRHIQDYVDEVETCRGCNFCSTHTELSDVQDQLEKALAKKSALRIEFARILLGIRSSTSTAEELRSFVAQSYSGALTPKSISNLLTQAKDKLYFRRQLLTSGGQYLDFDRAKEAISVGSNIYILYFNVDTKKDEDSWNTNREIITRLLNRNSGDYLVAVAECSAQELSLLKSRITFYRSGGVITFDMREGMDLVDQCFAQYDTKLLDTSKCNMPQGRKPLRLPCPHTTCDKTQVCDWTCYSCRMPLEYCDKYMYCECGRVKASDFTWQCNSPDHGKEFVKHRAPALTTSLRSLDSYKERNILVLGETGVGKSTFINAFHNYMQFGSLDDALGHNELKFLIPSSFSMQYIDRSRHSNGSFIQCDVKVDDNESEKDGSRGDSATQKATPYRMRFGDLLIRLIDTPGVGDVRGIEADQKNLASILGTISQYEAIHGIIILLKPNSSRLSLMFRFCVKELLTNLHKDAAKNIVWGFTNTRQSNYMPGDSYKPLERLISKHKPLGLELSPETVFCFDSESFRCLAAKKQAGIDMDNLDDFRLSWKRSVQEVDRLMNHVSDLEPHCVKSTLSLNRARELISQLTQPMATLTDAIQRTINLNKDKIDDLSNDRLQGQALQSSLHFDRIDIETERLDYPRTICKHSDCVDLIDVAGVKRPFYRSHCHPHCNLIGVAEDVVGHAGLIRCTAFGGHNTCHPCGHHWQEHMHIRYSQTEKTVRAVDPAVQIKIDANASAVQLKQTAIQSLEAQIQKSQEELQKIRDAAIRFAYFLKRKSITPYNDAMIAYIDMMIKEERQVVAHGKSSNVDVDKNETRLRSLEDSKRQYAERIKILEEQMDDSPGAQLLDEQGVEDLIQELYGMQGWGRNLKDLRDMEEWSKASSFREHEVKPQTSQAIQGRGWLGTVSNGFSAAKNFVTDTLTRATSALGGKYQSAHDALPGQGGSKRGALTTNTVTHPNGYDTRQKRRRLGDYTADPSQH
ncbi:hypothetical protein JX265_012851 [Neoarthrinium moseri]|uniref:G domain-containing protein n=1 Tax=Neoarthrinium moseri TaxID=1658444 RepID=A0A9P9W9Y0_9PEZI|nr:hypothetical protein JX265_012851 [Neoarthrinium moseri]